MAKLFVVQVGPCVATCRKGIALYFVVVRVELDVCQRSTLRWG